MTKTCSQCGAVQPSSLRVCKFCDSSLAAGSSSEESQASRIRGNLALNDERFAVARRGNPDLAEVPEGVEPDPAWRGELAQRLHAYRARRRKLAPNSAQSQLPFEERERQSPSPASIAVADIPQKTEEDFSFTIAIGRNAAVREDPRMVIDVSLPPAADPAAARNPEAEARSVHSDFHPVASIEERRLAAFIDMGCLLFAYGGFLALFGSLGGQFTLSKLSAAVYATTFAIVYLQYFALFTIFGGTTPGMMLRGLQVASFSGEPPMPRQMLLRSAGYMLSAGTFFLGFLWALWDEDALTWHDRLSHTYLSPARTFADIDITNIAHSR